MPDNAPENGGSDETRAKSPVYTTTGMSSEIRQSEILTRLAQYNYDPPTKLVEEIIHEYAIVLNQDCDLLQEFNKMQNGDVEALGCVLIYKMFTVSDMELVLPPGKDIRRRVKQNKDERYHFFEECPKELDLRGTGMPGLLVDFRRHFAITAKELYRQLRCENGAERRRRLETPYREHLQCRAAFYMQRVMIPVPHKF